MNIKLGYCFKRIIQDTFFPKIQFVKTKGCQKDNLFDCFINVMLLNHYDFGVYTFRRADLQQITSFVKVFNRNLHFICYN